MKKPFINHMFPNHWPPNEGDYLSKTKDEIIYSYYEKYCDDNDRQYCEYCEYCDEELGYAENSGYEDCNCQEANDNKSVFPKLSEITFQSILDMIPEGIKPSDVKISISLDSGDMNIYGQKITFSYKKIFEADPEGFKAAQKQYEENYQAYLVEKQKYDKWKRQEEIKELENKLFKLKND